MQTTNPTLGVAIPLTVDADAKPETSSAPFTYARPKPEPDVNPLVGSMHIIAVGEPCA